MRVWPLLALVGGCATFADSTSITFDATLPDMTAACAAAVLEERTSTGWVATDVRPGDAGCRGRIYARTLGVRWEDVRNEIPPQATTRWERVVVAPTSFRLRAGAQVPAGTTVAFEHLLVTESGDLLTYDAAPFERVDALGDTVSGDDERLVGGTLSFGAEPLDSPLDAAELQTNEPGPLAVANRSYADDAELHVLMVAEVVVPTAALSKTPTTVQLTMVGELAYEAAIRYGGPSPAAP